MSNAPFASLKINILDETNPDIDALVERMIRAVARGDLEETKRLLRAFDALGLDVFAVEFEARLGGKNFDGFLCDWALERKAWGPLAFLLRVGIRRDDPNAEEVFGGMSSGIDHAAAGRAVRQKWIETMRAVIAPRTLRQARWLLNHPMLWELGPVARSEWIWVATEFIALCEKAEIAGSVALVRSARGAGRGPSDASNQRL